MCDFESLLSMMRDALAPSTGCTEPSAIALNAATARHHCKGTPIKIEVRMDPYLFKNAMGVGIPGADERGVDLCVALGITAGDAQAGMNALHSVSAEALAEAKTLRDKVELGLIEKMCDLYIETTLTTDLDCVRVITHAVHDRIVEVSRPPFRPYDAGQGHQCRHGQIQDYSLDDFIQIADRTPVESFSFIAQAVEMNRNLYARADQEQLHRFVIPCALDCDPSPVTRAKRMAGSCSYARMSGIPLPVMTATGSGNQGITLYLTMEAVAEHLQCAEERKLRAMALASLVNIYVKSYIGPLSSICACGVSAGLGASLGIVYLLGGAQKEMLLAARSILGCVSGMICDGAKEGCASKVALSAGLAVEKAYLAMEGIGVSANDGILDEDFTTLISHLGEVVTEGMGQTNQTIVRIMKDKKPCAN